MNRTQFMPQYIFDWLNENHFQKVCDNPEYENYVNNYYDKVHLRAQENTMQYRSRLSNFTIELYYTKEEFDKLITLLIR